MDAHAPVLYPIERQILAISRADPSMIDLHVEEAVAQLARRYGFELEGAERAHQLPPRTDPRVEQLFNALATSCEWMLRRSPAPPVDWPVAPAWKQVELVAVVAALKRLHKSVKTWSERGGRTGYLEYIAEFLPQHPA